MTDLRPLSFDELIDRLCPVADTLILFHRSPDADAVGSAFALKRILAELGSRAFCVCSDELPSRLTFLTDGKQESVLPSAIPAELEIARIISVDTASPAQLGSLYELYGGQIDFMIDHHGTGEPYADYYIVPNAAATGELVFDAAKQLAVEERISMTPSICAALYAAISSDTGGFRFSNVTPDTHLRAAELLEYGVDAAEINHLLFDCKTPDQLRAQAAGISNLHLFADGKIAVITFPFALKMALGLSDADLDGLVEIARSIEGVKIAIALRQPKAEGVFRASVRASCDYDVAALCARFDGGGHKRAAGCTVTATDTDEAIQKLVSAIKIENL